MLKILKRKMHIFFICMAGFSLWFCGGAGSAQSRQIKVPIALAADNQKVFQKEKRVVLTGNVEVEQGEERIKADKITLYYAEEGDNLPNNIRRIEAEGHVFYINRGDIAYGENGVYDARAGTVLITGDVTLVQQERNVLKGDRLLYNLADDTVLIEGQKNRVQAVYYPENSSKK